MPRRARAELAPGSPGRSAVGPAVRSSALSRAPRPRAGSVSRPRPAATPAGSPPMRLSYTILLRNVPACLVELGSRVAGPTGIDHITVRPDHGHRIQPVWPDFADLALELPGRIRREGQENRGGQRGQANGQAPADFQSITPLLRPKAYASYRLPTQCTTAVR